MAILPLISILTGFICVVVFAARLDVCTQFIPLSVIQVLILRTECSSQFLSAMKFTVFL